MRKEFEVRLLVNALLREGSIVKLDTDREDEPFYVELSVGWPQLPYRRDTVGEGASRTREITSNAMLR